MNDEYQRMAANAICHAAEMAGAAWQHAAYEQQRPSVVFKPKLFKAKDLWWATYNGVRASGASPEKAMYAFDEAWRKEL